MDIEKLISNPPPGHRHTSTSARSKRRPAMLNRSINSQLRVGRALLASGFDALSRRLAESFRVSEAITGATFGTGREVVRLTREMHQGLTGFGHQTVRLADSIAGIGQETSRLTEAMHQSLACFGQQAFRLTDHITETINTQLVFSRTVESNFLYQTSTLAQKICGQAAELSRITSIISEGPLAGIRALESGFRGLDNWGRIFREIDWKIEGPLCLAELGCEEIHRFLLERSWGLPVSRGFALLFKLAELFEAERFEEIETILESYFGGRVDHIEGVLVGCHPRRSRLLKQAFGAHRRREFGLSIPLFLIQIDGIWNDLAEGSFYHRSVGKERIERLLADRDDDQISVILVEALEKCGALKFSSDVAATKPSALSRHAVLHGISVDYDTEQNSLKCISWLALLASIVEPGRNGLPLRGPPAKLRVSGGKRGVAT